MTFIAQNSLKTALRSSWIILKLIVPIYILADILFYYDILSYITFLFKPFVSLLGLPEATALSIVSGLFLNLYAAIAFAAPIGLNSHEWTILAVFLGIAHALLVETEIMKKLGISRWYSVGLRLGVGFCVALLVSMLPASWFTQNMLSHRDIPEKEVFNSIASLLQNALADALVLSLEVIALVSVLVFILDFLKSSAWFTKHAQKLNSGFSITVGVILGITYGAGILIAEYEKGLLVKKEIFFIGTYLMICHAIIEDTLLFVIFGANIWVIIGFRVFFATLISLVLLKLWKSTS